MSENQTPTGPTPETHPLLFKLAKEIGRPISFFDIETTGLNFNQPSFGITEIGFVSIMPDGASHLRSKMIDPENPIGFEATLKTGITQEMVQGCENFAAYAPKLERMLTHSLAIGFNCDTFDTPAIIGQFARYGLETPTGIQTIDARSIWKQTQGTKTGTLVDISGHFGVPFTGAHRALADVVGLADVFEQMLWRHGSKIALDNIRIDLGASAAVERGAPQKDAKPRAKKGEPLPPELEQLKAAIDASLAKNPTGVQFSQDLAEAGYALVLGSHKVPVYERAGTEGVKPESFGGGRIGEGYAWPAVKARLCEPFPENISMNASAQPSGQRPRPSDRQSEEAKAKGAILEAASSGEALDMKRIETASGCSAKSLSFALSSLLADGQVAPEQARNPEAQNWLDSNWERLPTGGKLKELLGACQNLGSPSTIDYTQLRVAIATRKAGLSPAKGEAQPRQPAAAQSERQKSGASHGQPAGAVAHREAFVQEPTNPIPQEDSPPFDMEMPPPFDM